MEKINAEFSFDVTCKCPRCKEYLSLADNDFIKESLDKTNRAENCNIEVKCDNCNLEFMIENIEF